MYLWVSFVSMRSIMVVLKKDARIKILSSDFNKLIELPRLKIIRKKKIKGRCT